MLHLVYWNLGPPTLPDYRVQLCWGRPAALVRSTIEDNWQSPAPAPKVFMDFTSSYSFGFSLGSTMFKQTNSYTNHNLFPNWNAHAALEVLHVHSWSKNSLWARFCSWNRGRRRTWGSRSFEGRTGIWTMNFNRELAYKKALSLHLEGEEEWVFLCMKKKWF